MEFVASELHGDAVVRNLELFGEAATHMQESVRGRCRGSMPAGTRLNVPLAGGPVVDVLVSE
ncbi:MAG: hypothetical protein NVSMB42_17040 [Herpetosiphon sp.]